MSKRASRQRTGTRPTWMLFSLALALLLSLLAPWAAPAHADRWVTECVDCPKYFADMTDHNLRLDTDGHPHIAYGGDHLYYAWHEGTSWHYETVDDSPGVGQYASLDIDGNGFPHISYYDSANYDLKYAYQDNSRWHVQTIDSEGNFGRYTSLALDESGYPHISYQGEGILKYAYLDTLGWHISTVDEVAGGSLGQHSSLSLDSNGYPHISYFGYDSYDNVSIVRYAYQNQLGWHIQSVTGELDYECRHTSLVLDSNNRPRIAYLGSNTGAFDLMYAYKAGSSWQHETVDEVVRYTGGHVSITLDASQTPVVSYFDGYYDTHELFRAPLWG